jgi:2-keto-4-pentenoate hydratase/2-oxohepta-3-ene-1,7-dioic acid hydratase in catechol pathway
VRFASCAHGDRRFAGLVDGDVVRPLRDVAELGAGTPAELLADPPLSDERVPLADVKLRPVVPRPGKVICMGLNYRAHVDEGVYEPPEYPVLFSESAETLVAAGEPIVAPPESSAVDYEAELAFGERMQSGNTRQFIFDIPAIVGAISEFVPLAPGDVVLTGTPSGVGYRREPKVLLRDGDRVVVEIERVGRLENPVVAERA